MNRARCYVNMKKILMMFPVIFGLLINSIPIYAEGKVSEFYEAARKAGLKAERLPVEGVMVVQKGDKTKIISSNGRYVFNGEVIDTWLRTPIKNHADAKRSLSYINFNGANFKVDLLEPDVIGEGKNQIAIFFDPLCPHCERLLNDLPKNNTDFTYKLLPIGVLGERSTVLVKQLKCAKNQDEVIPYILNHDFSKALEQGECSEEKQTIIAKRYIAAQALGVDSVPFMIRYDGKISRGYPEAGVAQWLYNKD